MVRAEKLISTKSSECGKQVSGNQKFLLLMVRSQTDRLYLKHLSEHSLYVIVEVTKVPKLT